MNKERTAMIVMETVESKDAPSKQGVQTFCLWPRGPYVDEMEMIVTDIWSCEVVES